MSLGGARSRSSQQKDEEQKDITEKESIKSVRELIFSGEQTKSIDISGHEFILNTLKNKDAKSIIDLISLEENHNKIYYGKLYTLAFSIKSIDGASLESFYEGDDASKLEPLQKRKYILENLDEVIFQNLWDQYVILKEAASEKIIGAKKDNIKK